VTNEQLKAIEAALTQAGPLVQIGFICMLFSSVEAKVGPLWLAEYLEKMVEILREKALK